MTCAEFDRQLDAWLAGNLDDASVREFERHAATCAACGDKLEAKSRVGELPRELEPPAAARAATLLGISRKQSASRWRRGGIGIVGIAAVALLAIAIQPRRKSASDFPGAARVLLARAHAGPQFTELDAAEHEIENALRDHPGDAELTTALARLRRQRDGLQQLVQSVNQ